MKKLSLGITLAAIASFISFSAIAEEQDANTQFNGLFGVKLGSVMPASKICETNKENLLVYKYELDQDSKELKQFRDYDISRDVFLMTVSYSPPRLRVRLSRSRVML